MASLVSFFHFSLLAPVLLKKYRKLAEEMRWMKEYGKIYGQGEV
jgi:hypothetical protein